MISTDGVIWHMSARYPDTYEVMDRRAKVQHRCSYDSEPIALNEGSQHIRATTLRPKVYEFTCTHCGQVMRVSYELHAEIKEHLPPHMQ